MIHWVIHWVIHGVIHWVIHWVIHGVIHWVIHGVILFCLGSFRFFRRLKRFCEDQRLLSNMLEFS